MFLDLVRGEIVRDAVPPKRLTRNEYTLLRVLASHIGEAVTLAGLVAALQMREDSVRDTVENVRGKLNRPAALPIRGPWAGYRLVGTVHLLPEGLAVEKFVLLLQARRLLSRPYTCPPVPDLKELDVLVPRLLAAATEPGTEEHRAEFALAALPAMLTRRLGTDRQAYAALLDRVAEEVSSRVIVADLRLAQATVLNQSDPERAAAIAEAVVRDPDSPPVQRAHAAIVAARSYIRLAEFEQAEQAMRGAEGVLLPDGLHRKALTCRGILAHRRRRHDDALGLLRQAARLAEAVGDSADHLEALRHVEVVAGEVGDAQEALRAARVARRLIRSLGGTVALDAVLNNAAKPETENGDPAVALAQFEAAMKAARVAGNDLGRMIATANAAEMDFALGRDAHAAQLVEEVYPEAAAQYPALAAHLEAHRSILLALKGRLAEAVETTARSPAVLKEHGLGGNAAFQHALRVAYLDAMGSRRGVQAELRKLRAYRQERDPAIRAMVQVGERLATGQSALTPSGPGSGSARLIAQVAARIPVGHKHTRKR
ncbi:MAG: hypothetical protein ACOZNI_25180 [Myxococcota bacterium]